MSRLLNHMFPIFLSCMPESAGNKRVEKTNTEELGSEQSM